MMGNATANGVAMSRMTPSGLSRGPGGGHQLPPDPAHSSSPAPAPRIGTRPSNAFGRFAYPRRQGRWQAQPLVLALLATPEYILFPSEGSLAHAEGGRGDLPLRMRVDRAWGDPSIWQTPSRVRSLQWGTCNGVMGDVIGDVVAL